MPDPAVVDTVDLRYFLFVGRGSLLVDLLGRPIYVPRVVYDPDEGALPNLDDMSEVTRSIRFQQAIADEVNRPDGDRTIARENAERLRLVHQMYADGHIALVDLSEAESVNAVRLSSRFSRHSAPSRFPLDAGEAACVAVAHARGWVLASDDTAALGALEHMSPGHAYERIRRLLRRAATEGRISEEEANAIHAEMVRRGFWDKEPPFPSANP